MKKQLSKCLAMLLAAIFTLSLVGCGTSSSSSAQQSSTPVESVSGEGEKTFYLSSVAEGAGDKIDFPWENMRLLSGLLYRTLFLAEPNLIDLEPDLATSYEVSEDGLTYTVELSEGNKWSDGEDITPEDVAFSVKTNLKAAVSNGIFSTAFGKIEGATEWKEGTAEDLSGLTVDGNTITFKLSSPHNSFPQVLAQFAILPQHALADVDPLELHNSDFWAAPVTSGAYRLDEMNPGNYYILVQNEYYNGTKPKIEKIVNYFVSDYITAAQAGQLDYFNTNATDVISEFSKLDYETMFPVDILFYRYFIVNMKGVDGNENPVMQNPKVREAIMYAIDRETLANELFPDLAHILNSGISNDSEVYNGVSYEYNPEKAKALLDEAGYDYNYTFRILYYYSDQTSVDFMEAIAYYLSQIGMKVEVTQSSQGTQDLFQTRDYDIGYKGLSAFDISEWYNEYSSTNSNFANIFGGDTTFDAALNDLSEATTTQERNDALKELQELEQENLYKLPLYTIGNNIFINTDHVKIPEDTTFGNPWYKSDIGFENWEIIG